MVGEVLLNVVVRGGAAQVGDPAQYLPGPRHQYRDQLEQRPFELIAVLMPGAREVLRRITDLGGTASYDDVQQHFAHHPSNPIPISRIGGTLTSIKAVQRRVGPDGAGPLLQRDER